MSQIILEFNKLINMQRALLTDNSEIYNQGATDEEIKAVEIEFGTSFPQEMKDLYKYVNGNKVYPDYFGSLNLIRGKFSLLSLKDALKYYNDIDLEEYQDLYEPDWFPGDKLFPVLDGGKFDVYWIDLNPTSDNKNKIYYTNTLSTPHCYAFLSLENMFQTFNMAYERKIIFKSEDMIDIKFEDFFQLCFDQTGLDFWRNK